MTLLIPLATILAMTVFATQALPLQAPIVVATGSGLYPRVAHDSQSAPVRQVMARGTIIAIFLAALLFVSVFLAMALVWYRGWHDDIAMVTGTVGGMVLALKKTYSNLFHNLQGSPTRAPSTNHGAPSNPMHRAVVGPSPMYLRRTRDPVARSRVIHSGTSSIAEPCHATTSPSTRCTIPRLSRPFELHLRAPTARSFLGPRTRSLRSDTASVVGLCIVRGPAGEIGQSDHENSVEGGESVSVDETASLSSGSLEVRALVS